ncbi:choline dehydrogenase, mitochondrial [Latimeria chalumnae]|uniref:Choline dehydrogenase n=1 Tax=Latimeria chalumnae TaxID=7897 RepID=H3ASQ5_LATCH|nr:PREDICTED: choline dehydrogenase, mitochondrial [Latimeria chalumnae]|eukprot:XP_005993052.1 PREDICTED: choline dehydrogenase, mitochondrial [Latimeria chalumnae]
MYRLSLPPNAKWKCTLQRIHTTLAKQLQNISTSSVVNTQKISSYNYVIVGAGSAGCVLANRLTENPNDTVLLLEAGPKDTLWGSKRLMWKIHMPAALIYNLCDDKYNWYYHTTPQKHMNNRVLYWPRGRVWGGSSSLNAMVYIRGHAEDYNRWEKEGATGWDYEHCLPYFKKAQCHELGPDQYRGGSGPLKVSRGKTNHPLHHAFLEAAQQAGYPFTEDMNGYQQEGLGWMDMTINKGQRWSTASAYLHPALSRQNLSTENRVLVTKILFESTKAVGVEYVQDGQKKKVYANKEIILSGGAINSPQLLMLSGIGNADDLKKLGIPAVCHLPGVGQNLQDHLELYVQQQCTKPITLYQAQKPIQMLKIGLEWLWKFTGYGATAHLETGGFIRSRPGVTHPDLQFHFLPSVVIDHGRVDAAVEAYQVHIGPMRGASVGWMKLKSADPREHPILEPNYLSTETDVWENRQCVKLAREIFAQKAFDQFRGPEMQPGSHVQSDKEIDVFVREKADSAYHPSCTCKMGKPFDPTAVVDPQTRVIGVENLRVVDSSIMPSVVSGNLNAPTIMIAEKAADIIKGLPSLHEKGVPVYEPKTLETQR